MRKIYILIYIGFFSCQFDSNAQTIPNTLLWKISGNGLQKASYLYGTLHLTDERIFNFGDSLYRAIENSEGFAIEVHPDDMTPYFIDLVKQEIKNARLIKDMVDEKEFKKYGPALAKKLKKPADNITTQDIFREKNKWLQDSYRNGKMPTIVDAYLFDIARRQGKWMGGVEDMADQKGLVDNLIDESDIRQIALSGKNASKSYIEKMIEVYINSDLNSIDSIMNFTDSAYRDALLIKRNKKMAWRMDSLSRVRSMVFAVGAAHLPGAGGLINLLKAKGFTVEPVFYSKKIKSADYKFKEVNIPWVTVDDPNGYYHVMMPGKPGDLQLYGVLEMRMYFNIFNGTGYLVASISTPYEKEGVDSIMGVFAMNVFKEKKLQHAKDVTINNISGKELEKTDEEGYKRGFLLYKNNVLYMVVGFATNRDAKSSVEIKKFLDSYQPRESLAKNIPKGYTYVDSIMAYKVELPGKPQSGDDLATTTDKSMKSNLMVCIDQQTGSYFIFGVNQTAPGYSIANDSVSLEQIHNNVIGKYTRITLDTTYIKNNRRVMRFEGRLDKADVNAKAYYEFRGNRWYALIAMYGNGQPKPVVERFINSFEVLEYQPVLWKKQVAADSLFSVWAPAAIKYHNPKDSSSYVSTRYEMYDTTRSDSYEVVVEDFGKYYWQNSDTALWNKLVKNIVTYKDTLLSRNDIKNGNITGVEILKKEKGSLNTSRKRMLLYGDTLYTLATTQQTQNIHDENVNKFFESLRFNKPAPATHLYISKTNLLLQDLLQKDSAIRTDARAALRISPFKPKDLPVLHEALLKEYSVFDDDYESVNSIIADKIIELKDSSSLNFSRKNYLIEKDKYIRSHLLDIMASHKTKENYAALLQLLLQSPPSAEPSYSFLNDIKDSAALAATIFPGILPLLKDTVMAPGIVYIAAGLVDSNMIAIDMLKPYQRDILQFAQLRYSKLIRDKDEDDYKDYSLCRLLGKFRNQACNAMLQKWLRVDNNYIRMKCVSALAANGEPVDKQILLKLAADKIYRVDLYNELKKLQKQQLFPRQYLSQQNFAQSMVYVNGSEDDDEPTAITFLSQKIISFKGKKARFFFYKITYGEDEKIYRLACAGPFDLDVNNMSSDKATGASYYEEEYSSSDTEKQMDALIKSMEGWYKRDEKQ